MSKDSALDLRARIDGVISERHIDVGGRLPPERELATLLAVSRTTLRGVLASMERTGAVSRVVGRRGGTFVADPADLASSVKIDRSIADSVPELLKKQGFHSGTRVISAAFVEAEPTHVEHLGVLADDLLVQLRRVRLANGVPISFETMYLPESRFPNLIECRLSGSLREVLTQEFGIVFGRVSESVEVVAAAKSTAAILQIATGSPLLAVTRVSRDRDGQRVEYSIDYFRADLTRLTIESDCDDDPVGLRPAPRGAA